MMYLEFFIWGAWFVTLGTYLTINLKANGAETAMAYSTQSWGAIFAPFIIGLIADRFFNAEKIYDMYTVEDKHLWTEIWIATAAFGLLVLFIFVLLFKNEKIIMNE